jgi:hypothetical protein
LSGRIPAGQYYKSFAASSQSPPNSAKNDFRRVEYYFAANKKPYFATGCICLISLAIALFNTAATYPLHCAKLRCLTTTTSPEEMKGVLSN